MKDGLTFLLACFALVALSGCSHKGSQARPNVLLILTDDQRYDSLSATGNPHIQTPALDSLAESGVLFERAYVTTSRCCPGRAALLTGQPATVHGIWNNHPPAHPLDPHQTLADHLGQAGYRTAWIGKWHLSNPGAQPVRGFDRWVSYEGPGSHFDQPFNVDGERVPSEGFQADRLTDYALDFLGEKNQRPFFMAVAFKNPHVPMTPAPRHAGLLADVAFPLPESAHDDPFSLPVFYRVLRSTAGRHAMPDPDQYARDVRAYWELMLSVDDNVQRLLDALHASGELDETMIILTTDNGQLLGEHGLQQKGLSYEPSIQVPLIMRFPKHLPEGARRRQLVITEDILPTVLESCGLEIPKGMHGQSLLSICQDPAAPWRERFLYLAPGFGGELGMVERAVVEERFKYVFFQSPGGTNEALFDRQADPMERINLAGKAEYAPQVVRLSAWMQAERLRLGDQ